MNTSRTAMIRGSNHDEAISLIARPEISEASFDVTTSFRGYIVGETSVTLFEVERFVEELVELERTRTGEARLTGTYDFELSIAPFEHRGDALVRFSLENVLSTASGRAGSCKIQGDFVIDAEWLPKTVQDLCAVLKPAI